MGPTIEISFYEPAAQGIVTKTAPIDQLGRQDRGARVEVSEYRPESAGIVTRLVPISEVFK